MHQSWKEKKCDNCGEAVEKILLLRGKRKEVDWLKFLMIEIRISICLTYFAQDGGFDRFTWSLEIVDMQYLRTSIGISRESLFLQRCWSDLLPWRVNLGSFGLVPSNDVQKTIGESFFWLRD